MVRSSTFFFFFFYKYPRSGFALGSRVCLIPLGARMHGMPADEALAVVEGMRELADGSTLVRVEQHVG